MQQHHCVLLVVVMFLSLWLYLGKLESDAQRKLREWSEDLLSEEHHKRDLMLASLFHHTHHVGREEELQRQISIMKASRREMQDENLSAINHYYRQLNVRMPNSSSKELQAFVNGQNWGELAYQVTYRELYSAENKYLGLAMAALQHARIVKAEPATGGTQLKVQVTLEGGALAYFKPKWFDRDFTILGEVFAGEDRHNGEVLAYHLDRLLDFRRAPIVVGRLVNLTELQAVSTESLSATFRTRPSGKRYDLNDTCFYGKCYYCKPEELVCGNGEMMEGVMILIAKPIVPLSKLEKQTRLTSSPDYSLRKSVHPYRRSYANPPQVLAWERDRQYCRKLNLTRTRMLDFVDTSIFDFLMGNADRHHYETIGNVPMSAVAHVDNGKSLANPFVDEMTVLAPLSQCCVVRSTTRSRLTALQNGILSAVLSKLLASDPLPSVVASAHLDALDRRLERALRATTKCIRKNKIHNVVLMEE